MEPTAQSQWCDSYTSPENSIFLAENVEGFQKCVKEILNLIEQNEKFSETTPETPDHKKSELTTHVSELSRMHNILAEQHGHLITELSRNSPSLIKKHPDSSDSSSPQLSQMLTPDQVSRMHIFRTPIGFDPLLSSGGGGSYASRRECSDSSFSLSSDSDSESFISINKLLVSPLNDDALKAKEILDSEALLKKIANLEEENTKTQNAQNALLETERAKVVELENKVAELRIMISDSNNKIETMGNELEASRQKLLTAEDEILNLKHELSSKILEETHWLQGQLGSSQVQIALLQKQLDSEKDKVLELQEEVSLCVADISVRDDEIRELNTKISQSMSEISVLKVELTEKGSSINYLNKKLETFEMKNTILMSEKDGVNTQLETLENCMNALQVEHVGLISSFDNAQKVSNELRLKVIELEREVDVQREVITDRAEEKREAIRQLSFSLEHYMSGYKELRQVFIGHKRHAVLTS